MGHILLSGIVRDLAITKGYEDLVFTAETKSFAGIAAIAAAASGNATSSTMLSNSSSGAEIDMEFFSCLVGETPLKGRFYKVDFTEGETIEFVATIFEGVGEVHGARDPLKRFIWTLPYQTRGHIAQKRYDRTSSFIVSAVFAFVAALFAIYQEKTSFIESWRAVLEFSTIAFFSMLIVNFLSRWHFLKFSFAATEVFRAFGYEDPATLDLPKQHDRADVAYCNETGEPRPLVKPWRYRYEPLVGK